MPPRKRDSNCDTECDGSFCESDGYGNVAKNKNNEDDDFSNARGSVIVAFRHYEG